ncbi:MAG TPA: ATP-binding protein [Chryseosolibacter sp.]|nr:ATP-binding protein [Chryseosolibacter sp.]
MVSRNFRLQIVVRVLIIIIVCFLLAWSIVTTHYLRALYAGAALVIAVWEFLSHVDRLNRDFKSFLLSLLHNDFTVHFESSGRSKSFNELYEALNRITGAFKRVSADKEAQHRFLELLIEHLRVGVVSFDEEENVHLANQSIKSLLDRPILRSLRSFEPTLANTLREIHSGETRLFKMQSAGEPLNLSIHASEFKLENRYYKLVSMQNIRSELDAREMEAWQKLIRVLTHEIMNSVSPIISLSESMHERLKLDERMKHDHTQTFTTLDQGLEAIRSRSRGLHQFTQSYRKLTAIPRVSLKKTTTREIFQRVTTLMGSQMREKGIEFDVSDANLPIFVDPDLMEHVLINLLLNAMEAVAEIFSPKVTLNAFLTKAGSVLISVADNGEGIDQAAADKIFIPFFTTRKNGSGIGLALCRQIVQQHRAEIHFTSEKGKGAEFVIVLSEGR